MRCVCLSIIIVAIGTVSVRAESAAKSDRLQYDVSLKLDEAPAIEIVLTSEPPAHVTGEAKVEWSLDVVGLKTEGAAKLVHSPDMPNRWTIHQPLATKQLPQTTRITGAVTLRRGAAATKLSIDKTLLPSINHWIIVGPFDWVQAPAMTNKFRQMRTPKLNVELPKGYGGEPAMWHRVSRELTPETDLGAEFVLDLNQIFGQPKHDRAMAFAWTTIEVPEFTYAALAIGSADGLTVWLNNQEVLRNIVKRDYHSGEDHVLIKLEKGRNVLLVRIGNRAGAWRLGMHLQDRDGQPLLTAKVIP